MKRPVKAAAISIGAALIVPVVFLLVGRSVAAVGRGFGMTPDAAAGAGAALAGISLLVGLALFVVLLVNGSDDR